jgi:capsular exopolysaccharide synthesis family protein
LNLPSISGHPSVAAIVKDIGDREHELSILAQRYKPKHPKYAAAVLGIDRAKGNLPTAVAAAAATISNQLASARQSEERLVAELKQQETKTYGLGKLQVEYDALKREIEADRAIYESLLNRFKETDLSKGLEKNPVRLVEGAVASYTPVRPDRKKMIMAGSMGGLALGLVLALGLHLLDSSIKTVNDAEAILKAPVLGAVSLRTVSSKKNPLPDLDTVHHKHGPVAEAFRYLRSALMLLGKPEDRRSFMFTSAVPAEGKSFCASNYAVTLAQQGLRTVIVDCDLRKPTLGEVFLDDHKRAGVTNVLVGQASIEEVVIETSVPNLFIITAGSRAPNPSELLSNASFPQFLKELDQRFDRVVLDTAPILAVSDPLLIVPHVSTVCMVVRAHNTPRSAVQRAKDALSKTGRSVSGIVLNRLPTSSGGYYYYYYAGHYGSKGVYGAPKSST